MSEPQPQQTDIKPLENLITKLSEKISLEVKEKKTQPALGKGLDIKKERERIIEKSEEDAILEEFEKQIVDLAPVVRGDIKLQPPEVCFLRDDFALFYKNKLNEIHAEPGVGKTNIMVSVILDCLERKQTVLYLDPESEAHEIVERLKCFGASEGKINNFLRYVKLDFSIIEQSLRGAAVYCKRNKPDVVILDGLVSVLAATGTDENNNTEVLYIIKELIKPLRTENTAVIIADHVARAAGGRGARGAGAKLGEYDGSVFVCELGKAYSRKKAGHIRLRLQKDRSGFVGGIGEHICNLHFEPVEGKTAATWEYVKDDSSDEKGEPKKPTVIMQRIFDYLNQFKNGDCVSNIRKAIGGRGAVVDWALRCLVEESKVKIEEKGNSKIYKIHFEKK